MSTKKNGVEAVEDMLRVMAGINPRWADQIVQAMSRGLDARTTSLNAHHEEKP
jgi:hypothetical protein